MGQIILQKPDFVMNVEKEISAKLHFLLQRKKMFSIVRNAVYRQQCSYLAVFFDADGPELSVYIYMDKQREERRILESKIDDALLKYCADQGIDSSLFVPLITTNVLHVSAHHAPKVN